MCKCSSVFVYHYINTSVSLYQRVNVLMHVYVSIYQSIIVLECVIRLVCQCDSVFVFH